MPSLPKPTRGDLLHHPPALLSTDDIDRYCDYLSGVVEQIAVSTVPIRRPSPWAAEWWTIKV